MIALINKVRGMISPRKLETKPQAPKTLIETRKLSTAKRTKIKKEATKPVTKGRKPTTKRKK